MIAFAALTGPLPRLGVVAVALLAAGVLLLDDRRLRAMASLGTLALAPVLLLADIWSSPQLRVVHRHPAAAVVGIVVALAVLLAAAFVLARRPRWVAILAMAALPFRVPVQAGGATSNLLVPLYLVVAAGALAGILSVVRGGSDAPPPGASAPRCSGGAGRLGGWVLRLLAVYVVLYAVQATYSADFVKALQNMVFFYVPFTLLLALVKDLDWRGVTLRDCLRVTVVLAIAFSLIGFFEYATKTIILNPKLVVTNDLHAYFTVNSVFFDPDIFGRYLALVMTLLAVGLIYPGPPRKQAATVITLAILWSCLVLTLSRSSLGALLVGLAVLAALRWRPTRAVVAVAAVVALGAVAVAASPATFGLNQGINGASSGRGGLVSGGLALFSDRPVWGYGSGSFISEYRAHHRRTATALSASHTIPITVAAEQGAVGEISYLAFVLAAILCLLRGARGDPVRCAVAAAFIALVFHTMLYADFLEDPTTWVLLAIGLALASAPIVRTGSDRGAAPEAGVAQAPAA